MLRAATASHLWHTRWALAETRGEVISMCALKKATENKSEHGSVCQHSERGLQTFVLLLGSVSLSPVYYLHPVGMLAGLAWASGKFPKCQKRTVWATHDKFIDQFSDLVSEGTLAVVSKENSKVNETNKVTRKAVPVPDLWGQDRYQQHRTF